MIRFEEENKTVSVWPSARRNRPAVYLHTFANEQECLCQELQADAVSDFTLVMVSGLDWNHDMVPWDIPPISVHDTACTGGADHYLDLLVGEIMPKAEKEIPGEVLWRGIAGYSLAGLFAVYALYRTAIFSRAASASGSLWFPGFREYVFSHEMKKDPEHIYFSLGDRECRTGNPWLKVVQERTEEIEAFYRGKGIHTVFRKNKGGHTKNVTGRTAKAITWILNQ